MGVSVAAAINDARGEPGGQVCLSDTPALRGCTEGARFAQSTLSRRAQQEAGMEDGESASVEGGLEEGKPSVRNTAPRSGGGLGGTRAALLRNIDFIEQGITEVGT